MRCCEDQQPHMIPRFQAKLPCIMSPVTDQLLYTKLFVPPLRPSLVRRARLTNRLNQGENRKLMLVSAPAGFGKTTLVVEWLNSNDHLPTTAWLSLEPADNDPVRFWTYALAAIQKVEATLGAIAADQVKAAQAGNSRLDTQSVLTMLINDLVVYQGRFALVLDDYHHIRDPIIHEAIVFLLTHSPPNFHLIITTRADPPLSLHRLRAEFQLSETREKDLRFSQSESAEFLNSLMGLKLSDADVAALDNRTEGWAASLQLAALALLDRPTSQRQALLSSFSGSQAYIVDYLMAEVLGRQSPEIHSFLLRTSILERLSGSLCDALIGEHNGAATLESLDHANLFLTPLDDRGHWYRYHRLFADVLRERLLKTRPGEVAGLHRQAAGWLAQNGQPRVAMGHAIAGEDFGLAAAIGEQAGGQLLASGEWPTLLEWLDALPDDVVHQRPELTLYAAWASALAGRLDDVPAHLSAVERWLEAAGAGDRSERPQEVTMMGYRGQLAALRGWLASIEGDVQAAIDYSQQALSLVPDDDFFFRGIIMTVLGIVYSFMDDWAEAGRLLESGRAYSEKAGNRQMALVAGATLGQVHEARGQLRRAAANYRRLIGQTLGQINNTVAAAHYHLGILLYEWNRLDEAQVHFETAVNLGRQAKGLDVEVLSRLWLGRIQQAMGDWQEADRLIEAIDSDNLRQLSPPVEAYASAMLARLSAGSTAESRPDERISEIVALADEPNPTHSWQQSFQYLIAGQLLLDQRRWEEATQWIGTLVALYRENGLASSLITALAMLALAEQGRGNGPQAQASLGEVLELAAPEDYLRTFLDLGQPMALLLKETANIGSSTYHGRLLDAFANVAEEAAIATESRPTIEKLKEREIEILRFMALGLSNPDIASELFLSAETVKWYSKSLYQKLDVHSRTEAVARAIELGLI
jgi:LuxR family maltose regulon positive regulatory protein